MERMDGKVALVTGAASGIGAACASRLLAEGAKVAGIDVQEMVGEHAWGQSSSPDDVFFEAGIDVSDAEAVEDVINRVSNRLGPIDVLVNVAGIAVPGTADTISLEDWDRTINVNLKGCFLTTRFVVPSMLERGTGSIVHIGSTAGLEGGPGTLAYSASKGGVVNMTKAMAWDYGSSGVRVNCVCPGFIKTPLVDFVFEHDMYYQRMVDFTAMGRHGNPSEVASAVSFLSSDDASFINGHALVVDGGWMAGRSVAPPAR